MDVQLAYGCPISVFSLVIFLAKTSKPNITLLVPDESEPRRPLLNVETYALDECPQLKLLRIDRAIYFGSVSYLQNKLQQLESTTGINHILLVASRVNYIDMAGGEMLAREAKRLQSLGGGLYICGLKAELWQFFAESGFLKAIGSKFFYDNKAQAIHSIYKDLNHQHCQQCHKPVFNECRTAWK